MKKIIIGVLLFMVSSISFASQPPWVNSGLISAYNNQNRFIVAVGEGQSSSDAVKLSYSRIAEQIKVSISSSTKINKEYHSSNGQFKQKEDVEISIQTRINLEDLEGIKTVERYFDEKSSTYYVFAVFDKVKTENKLSFEIEGLFKQIRQSLTSAKSISKQADVSKALLLMLKTSHVFQKSQKKLIMHQLFAKAGMQSLYIDELSNLRTQFDGFLNEIFSQISIESLNGDYKEGSPELGVSEAFLLSFKQNGQTLKNIPVQVLVDEGVQLDVDSTTNTNGELSVLVRSMPYSGKVENKLKVKLAYFDTPFNSVSPTKDLFVLLSQKSDVSIALVTKIKSKEFNSLDDIINDGLSVILSDENYNVDKSGNDTDYIVEVFATVVNLTGYGDLKFSKISGVIKIKSGKTHRVLKTIKINAEETKAGALSTYDAAEKAASKVVPIMQYELLEVLENNIGRD